MTYPGVAVGEWSSGMEIKALGSVCTKGLSFLGQDLQAISAGAKCLAVAVG